MNKIGAYGIYVFLLITLFSCNKKNQKYLDESKKIDSWLREQKIKIDSTDIWRDVIDSDRVSLSLSSGVAGKVLFYLELYLASGDRQYLNEAIQGCDFIIKNLPQSVKAAKSIRNASSLYGEISGSAFVLTETYKVTNDTRWRNQIDHCLSLLDSLSLQPDGRYWNNFNDVLIGSSGTGLLLLYLYQELQIPKALQMAQDAAKVLEERAIRNQDSLYWYLNQETDMNLPNFSHGAAGIGYFFARLYETTNDPHYLDIATNTANYLELIAWKPEQSFLLPYGFPDYGWEREYDIGWAHGPAGTARLFYKLWQISKDEKWLDIVKQCSGGIQYSGLPNTPNEHFGTEPFPIDMRFGLGGVIDFYINLKREHVLDADLYLDNLMAILDSGATALDPGKKYWQIKRYGFMAGEKNTPITYTGYFYGAAGLGRLYIRYHNLINNHKKGIKLPDNPF